MDYQLPKSTLKLSLSQNEKRRLIRLIKKFHKDHIEFSGSLTNENWLRWTNSPVFWVQYALHNIKQEDVKLIAHLVMSEQKISDKYFVLRDMIIAALSDPDKWLTLENNLSVNQMIEKYGMPE